MTKMLLALTGIIYKGDIFLKKGNKLFSEFFSINVNSALCEIGL